MPSPESNSAWHPSQLVFATLLPLSPLALLLLIKAVEWVLGRALYTRAPKESPNYQLNFKIAFMVL